MKANLTTTCPSCQRDYEEYQGFALLLCAECADLRTPKHQHSEEDVQEEIKKALNQRFSKNKFGR